ncbi:hypothetical protein OH77DRAFT_1404237, partial [Trametes cingulata]
GHQARRLPHFFRKEGSGGRMECADRHPSLPGLKAIQQWCADSALVLGLVLTPTCV